jgi:uncharacterized protein
MPIEIAELLVYPVKSLRGVSLTCSAVERRGLRHDRRWMVVDEDGRFMTQRELYKMALIDTAITDSGLVLSREGKGSVEVPLEPCGPMREVQIWNSICQAQEVGQEPNRWLSETLGVPAALVFMPETTERPISGPEAKGGEVVGFADAQPILFASQASIDDLNAKLGIPIPIRRFRPNVVIKGCDAFEEDTWQRIEFEQVSLRKTKRCGRCLVTTIDINTATPGQEPLRTLNTYRKDGNNVFFGCYYAPEVLGELQLGYVGQTK